MNKNRQTSHLTNVLSYDLDGNIVLLHTPSGTDNSARIPTTSWVRTYVTGLTYATQSYVSTQISNLIDAAPGALDTLNELAAALGDDPNFATTITNSLATKLALTGGTLTGDLTLSGVNPRLYFTDTDNNPDYFISNTDGTFTVYDVTNSVGRFKIYTTGHAEFTNNVTAASFIKSGGTSAQFLMADGSVSTNPGWLTGITSGQVTTALGFTPYNSTNPSGYITGITSSNVTTALGYTPYNSSNPAGYITSSGNISGYAGYLPTSYIGGVQANPQTYFNNGVGVKVAMTGSWSTWSDTLWINGYSGGDVKQMCALHTLRNGTPRMAISVQAHDATSYGTYYEFITSYNIASQTVASAGNATTAGGLSVHSDRNNEANKIVRTDVNGYIQAGWINTTSGDNGTSAITRIYASDDGYIRFYTPANFRQVLDVPTRTGGSASGSWSINAATATGQQSGAHFTLNTGGAGYGLVGVYNPDLHQGFFAMGSSYTLGSGGTLANFYGVSWSYDYSGRQLNTGYNLQHCMAVANAGTVYTVIGQGIWTSGLIRASGSISAGGTITGSNLSGTNTGDQTNISGKADGSLKLWAASHPNDYYIVNNWTGSYWRLTTNHGSPVQVGYADSAGSAGSAGSVTNGMYLSGSQVITGEKQFQTNNGGSAVNNSNSASLQAYSTGNNTAFMSFHRAGYYAVNFGLDNDNWMRIGGWSAAANRWQLNCVSGDMVVNGDVTAFSDARVKENVVTVDSALDKVLALRGVYYTRIDSDDKKRKIGVIAQETEVVLPEVVNTDAFGTYNVSYGNFAGLFIEAFKEQQKQIEELKSIINGLTK